MLNEFIINKGNIISNVKQIRAKNSKALICAMVKANAYGVGLNSVVKILSNVVNFFGVSSLNEAKQVKKLTNKKILIVGALEYVKSLNTNFYYTCNSVQDVQFLISQNKTYNIHLKINTGMNRYGISNKTEFLKVLDLIKKSKLKLEGVFTHFATDDEFVQRQFKLFKSYLKILKSKNLKPIIHADNSVVNLKYNHNLDMVRIGFNIFNKNNEQFKSAVTIKAKIVQINKCVKGDVVGYNNKYVCASRKTIAVVSLGYADGFSTKYIGLKLNFKGKLCTVVNVCMDCFMLDVSNVETKKGDDIFILGEENSLKTYSNYSGISEYEVMCNFSHIRACVRVKN